MDGLNLEEHLRAQAKGGSPDDELKIEDGLLADAVLYLLKSATKASASGNSLAPLGDKIGQRRAPHKVSHTIGGHQPTVKAMPLHLAWKNLRTLIGAHNDIATRGRGRRGQ